ncbi:MAG: TIGR03943 family protein [Dehalobacterium sp.]
MKFLFRKGINYEAVFKIVIFLGFALFFYVAIQSGTVRLYVHERIVPYLKFAVWSFALMAFFTLGEVLEPAPRKTPVGRYALFLITLILAVSLPAAVAVPDSMYLGSTAAGTTTLPDPETNDPAGSLPANDSDNNVSANEMGNELWGLSLQEGKVVMDDYNFVGWINEIYERIDIYQGIEIETSGFVFRIDGFSQEQFVPARMMMVCCAADAQPVGFLCRYDKADALPSDSWVKVTGIISRTTYDGEIIPLIAAKKVVVIERPDNDYVYPLE